MALNAADISLRAQNIAGNEGEYERKLKQQLTDQAERLKREENAQQYEEFSQSLENTKDEQKRLYELDRWKQWLADSAREDAAWQGALGSIMGGVLSAGGSIAGAGIGGLLGGAAKGVAQGVTTGVMPGDAKPSLSPGSLTRPDANMLDTYDTYDPYDPNRFNLQSKW